MRRRSPFLRATEQEVATHGPAIAALRARLEALDGSANSDAVAILRAAAAVRGGEGGAAAVHVEPRLGSWAVGFALGPSIRIWGQGLGFRV